MLFRKMENHNCDVLSINMDSIKDKGLEIDPTKTLNFAIFLVVTLITRQPHG